MIAVIPYADQVRRFLRRRQSLASAILKIGTLAGCGTRGTIAGVVPVQAQSAEPARKIVATLRARSAAPEFFFRGRDFNSNFAQFDVAIPPGRKPGTIRYPKAKPDRAMRKNINAVIGLAADLEVADLEVADLGVDVFRKQAPPVLALGAANFQDDQKVGPLERGGVLIQSGTNIVISPLAN